MDRKPRYTQAVLVSREASDGIDGGPPAFTFRVTSETTDRWGESIATDGWRIDHYQSNPVVLDSHQYEGIKNIVGRVTDLRFEWDDGTAPADGEKAAAADIAPRWLVADIAFNDSERGQLARSLVEQDNLNAVSVGFISHERTAGSKTTPPKHTDVELLEISVVPIPANQEALRVNGFASPDDASGVVPPHSGVIMPEDDASSREWKAPEEDLTAVELPDVFAWVDPDNYDLPAGRKLAHHMRDAAGDWVTCRAGVFAAMAEFFGTEGQRAIMPESDRRGVYAHLARHYRQLDAEPPEFRTGEELDALEQGDRAGLFWEGEPGTAIRRETPASPRQVSLEVAVAVQERVISELRAALAVEVDTETVVKPTEADGAAATDDQIADLADIIADINELVPADKEDQNDRES